MNLLTLDRSTDVQSAAFATDAAVHAKVFAGENARSADWPVRIRDFLAEHGAEFDALDAIVVGTGPGSFAGIRAAIAFAQGLELGVNARRRAAAQGVPTVPLRVYGLPSAVALARESAKTAVVGDARRDRYWVILYDGVKTVADFTLLAKEALSAYVPDEYAVATPDGARIGDLLSGIFGARFLGNATPLASRLAEIARAHPELPREQPLPVYLSPAVRT